MINILNTLAATTSKFLTELRKHAKYDTKEMRSIMLAIIILDMIEWSNYINTDITEKNKEHLLKLLTEYVFKCDNFIIKRNSEI